MVQRKHGDNYEIPSQPKLFEHIVTKLGLNIQ